MNNTVKFALYLILTLVASVSGYYALASFNQLMELGENRISKLDQIEIERPVVLEKPAAPDTNQVVSSNFVESGSASNTVSTNATAALETTNEVVAATSTAPPASPVAVPKPKTSGRMGLWSGLFVVSVIALGLLIAADVSHFMGNRALKTLYNEEGEGIANPEYEKAEEMWANGHHLDAVSLMREYLKKNPREQHVAIRIAEIYEKDLNNHLAAALEYEEVLKHKLQPERWGWAAIHLCNLYFKLNQEEKAYPLLRRIVNEYPTTPAADKARKRLEQVEGVAQPFVAEPTAPSEPSSPAPGSGALPPGFRPRK